MTPRRDAPGPFCERRHLRTVFVTALGNAGAEPACPGQVCPAGLVPALPGGRERCRVPRAEKNPPGGEQLPGSTSFLSGGRSPELFPCPDRRPRGCKGYFPIFQYC